MTWRVSATGGLMLASQFLRRRVSLLQITIGDDDGGAFLSEANRRSTTDAASSA